MLVFKKIMRIIKGFLIFSGVLKTIYVMKLVKETLTYVHQGVRNVSFSERFAYVLNGWSPIESFSPQIFALILPYFPWVSWDHPNPLSTNFTKWSNTLKQFVGKLPTNCLGLFDHFVGLALKGLTKRKIEFHWRRLHKHFWKFCYESSLNCSSKIKQI